jgi:hypothetical protein
MEVGGRGGQHEALQEEVPLLAAHRINSIAAEIFGVLPPRKKARTALLVRDMRYPVVTAITPPSS